MRVQFIPVSSIGTDASARRGRALSVVRCLILLLVAAHASEASTLFGTTTLGALAYNQFNTFSMIGDSLNPALGWVNSTMGFEFSLPSGTYHVDHFTLPLRDPVDAEQATFTLYDGGTRPETALASIVLNLPGSTSYSLYDLMFPSITLSGGQNYFLIGSVPQATSGFEQIDWAASSPGSTVPVFYGQTWLTGTYANYGFLGWNSYAPAPGPAWQLTVNAADAVDAPEPGVTLLVGAGLLAVGGFRRHSQATAKSSADKSC